MQYADIKSCKGQTLIQGQFSNVCWKEEGGEKKMNIDLTLVSNVGKKPSHLTQKTPSFCWILDGEETHTLQPDSSSQGYLNNQTNSILRFELSN